MFQTERLILRAYKGTDVDAMVEGMSEYRVQLVDNIGSPRPFPPKVKDRIESMLNDGLFHAVLESKSTHEYIGFILLKTDHGAAKNRNAELAINLASKHWDQGYGTEALRFVVGYAFRGLGLHRVSLSVFGGNDRAARVYEKTGFVREAVRRRCNWVEGEWRDIIVMGLLEEEWRDMEAQRANLKG